MSSRIRRTLKSGIAALAVSAAVIIVLPADALAFSRSEFGRMGGLGRMSPTNGLGHMGSFGRMGRTGHMGEFGHVSSVHAHRGLKSPGHGRHEARTAESRRHHPLQHAKNDPENTPAGKNRQQLPDGNSHGTNPNQADGHPHTQERPGTGTTPNHADSHPHTQERPGTGSKLVGTGTPLPQVTVDPEPQQPNDNWEIEQRRRIRELAQERTIEGIPPDERPSYVPPVSLSTQPVEETPQTPGPAPLSRGLQDFITDYFTIEHLLKQARADNDIRMIWQLESMETELIYIIDLYTSQGAQAVNDYLAEESRKVLYQMIKITANSANLAITATSTAVNNALPGGNPQMPTRLQRTPTQVRAMINNLKAKIPGQGTPGAMTPPRTSRNPELMQGGTRPALTPEPTPPTTTASNAPAEPVVNTPPAEPPATTGTRDLSRGLDQRLAQYYRGKPQPPMHTTTRTALNGIVASRKLEAPARGGASWSYSGTLRAGDIAIRLRAGAEKFVKLFPSTQGHGQVPRYYPGGVGNGSFRTYIPTEYLEYFDVASGEWVPLAR